MTADRRAWDERAAMFVAGAVTLAAAVWFRVAGLFVTPFWVDEAYSSYNAGKGFGFIWTVVPLYDSHPPLYYSFLRLWSLFFGESLLSYRLIGVACGLLTVFISGWASVEMSRAIGRRGLWPGIVGAALAACAPLLIEQSREVRPYPLMILAYAAALFAIVRIARESAERKTFSTASFATFLATLELMMWLHNVGPVFGVALTVSFLIVTMPVLRNANEWKRVVVGFAIAAVAYLPCLFILVREMHMWSQTASIRFHWSGLQWKLAYVYGAVSVVAIVAAFVLASSAAVALRRGGMSSIASALLTAALLPAVVSIVVSVFASPVFLVRTLTPLGIPIVLLLSAACNTEGLAKWLVFAAFSLLLVQNVTFDVAALHRPPKEDWYPAVRWLQQRYRPGDAVFAYPNEGALPFDRAVRDLGVRIASIPVPAEVPALGVPGAVPVGNRGVVALPPQIIRMIVHSPRAQSFETIWLLRLGPETHDFDDAFLRELSRDRTPVGAWRSGAIDIVGLRRSKTTGAVAARE
jgi:hypothetical protein